MTYYLLMNNNVLSEMIPELTDTFPGIPAVERYTLELLAQCVKRDSLEGVELGMTYDPEHDIFFWPDPAPDLPDYPGGPAPQPTPQEDADAMMVDHEYRLTLLELGVTDDAV